MKINQFLVRIRNYPKPFYSLVDFEKIFEEDKITIQKSLARFVRQKLLTRLHKNVYVLTGSNPDYTQIASLLYQPNYLSFESVLFRHGVINQPLFGATFATTNRSKKIQLSNQEFWFTQIRPSLWWGFTQEKKTLVASLEKAIVDMIYLRKRGKRSFSANEWYWPPVNKKKLSQYLLRAGLTPLSSF